MITSTRTETVEDRIWRLALLASDERNGAGARVDAREQLRKLMARPAVDDRVHAAVREVLDA